MTTYSAPTPRAPDHRRHMAVIGSGVSGLVAAHVLATTCRVTLFEADARLGGHAHTHELEVGGRSVAVDSGFIVHNDRTYPTLTRLFDELGVETQHSEMSMSVRSDPTPTSRGLEYAGALGARGLFPTGGNVRNGAYLRMLFEVKRFHRYATEVLAAEAAADDEETLREFVTRVGLSDYLVTYFLEPLVAAVWSCDPQRALDYPARYLFTFLDHHGMLTVFGSPTWKTVVHGSARYVERVAAGLDEVLVNSPVTKVRESATGVEVTDGSGRTREFDGVVVATHPHQALRMLAAPTRQQRQVLSAIPYSRNEAQLHTDESVLPRHEAARASWNYWRRPDDRDHPVLVSYDISRLMRLDASDRTFIVTLGGADLVDPRAVVATMTYEHPLYTPDSVAAQRRLPLIDTDRIAFAGAYHGWGFHEDGAASGVRAARRLGVEWSRRRAKERPLAEVAS